MRKVWVYDPHSGGMTIPPAVRRRIEGRLLDYVKKHHARKFARIDVRFRGALCYIDGYEEPEKSKDGSTPPTGETPIHLCRIRYSGSEDRWSFAHYTYSHEKYEPGFFLSGEDHGTPEEAFETAALFY